MKSSLIWKLIPTFILLAIQLSSNAQYYIREDWKQIKESPDSISLSRSIPDIDGDILQIGSEYDSTELSNISITCYSSLGIEKWNYQWNSGYDQADYGVALKVDSVGNIHAAGVSYNPGSGWYETVVLKLNDTGGLIWDNILDNPFGNAIVTDIDADNAGHAFVVANHESMSGSVDVHLAKLDSSGNTDWTESYSYFGKDIGSKMLYSSSPSEQVSVYGLSEDSINVWSYLTLTYDKEGNFIKAFRTKANDLYLETPEGFIEGNDKNFYLCGSQSNGVTARAILIKLNPDLNKIWLESSDSSNDEGAVVLTQGSDGSLYVSGWKQNADYRSISLKKFDTSGTLLWSRLLNPPMSMNYSEPTAITTDNDRVLITGFRRNAHHSEVITAEYDTSGSFHWVERFYHDQTAISYPTDVLAINSSVYVTGNVVNTSQTQWVTIKYDVLERDTANIYKDGKPIAAKNELIIRFNPAQVNTDEIDNVNRYSEYGSLEDYLKPTAYATVSDLLCSQAAPSTQSFSTNCDDFKLLKVFKEMKTKDSVTVSRLGDSIRIPKFWSTFVMSFPEGIDIKELSDSLNALFPLVIYCHINPTIELLGLPNDPEWFDQTSLQDPDIGDFGIAIDSAWDIQPTGKPEIKIGVFDSGIDWKHPDFGYDGVNRSSSKIAGGYDFFTKQDLFSLDSGERNPISLHGTAVSGVIGAIKNNDIGIAGIAGHDTVAGISGSSLFGLIITNLGGFRSHRLDYVADAILSTSILDTTVAYG